MVYSGMNRLGKGFRPRVRPKGGSGFSRQKRGIVQKYLPRHIEILSEHRVQSLEGDEQA